MPKVKPKRKKSIGAKESKKRDYGKPLDEHAVPAGFTRSSGGRHFTFTQFGDSIRGKFLRVEEQSGKGKSDILHWENDEGVNCTAFMSYHIQQHLDINEIKKGDEFILTFANIAPGRGGRRMKVFVFDFKPAGAPVKKKAKKKPVTKKGKK
jgi:hypothetical protein